MRTIWNTDSFRQSLLVVNLATRDFDSSELRIFFYYFYDNCEDHWTVADRYNWAKSHVDNFRSGQVESERELLSN